MDARVRRLAGNLDIPSLRADRTDSDLCRQPAIDVKCHRRLLQIVDVYMFRAVQSAFFANGEKQRDRRMRQLALNERRRERDQSRYARAIVATKSRRPRGHDAIVLANRLCS